MNAQAVVHIHFSSENQLKVILDALKPETKTSSTNRSKVQMTTENQTLVLEFNASDTSALRASVNSYLRLIGVAMNLQNLTKST
jgi:KEOPS complex subunit Pcc1